MPAVEAALSVLTTGGPAQHSAGATDRGASALRTLDRLVGGWTVSGPGGLTGEVRCDRMDGGRFLVQQVNLPSAGEHTRAGGELRSPFFGAGGEVLGCGHDLAPQEVPEPYRAATWCTDRRS